MLIALILSFFFRLYLYVFVFCGSFLVVMLWCLVVVFGLVIACIVFLGELCCYVMCFSSLCIFGFGLLVVGYLVYFDCVVS